MNSEWRTNPAGCTYNGSPSGVGGSTRTGPCVRIHRVMVLLFGTLAGSALSQTPVDIQPVKVLRPSGSLSTCVYSPVPAEAPFFKRLSDDENTNNTAFGGAYTIHGKIGQEVAWFGIVRGIRPPSAPGGDVTLLVQHHYFDGMTDCHIMLVAKTGDGDFVAKLNVNPEKIPALALVRVYGKVTCEKDGVPQVAVEYMRVWPWMTFTFTDLAGADHSNPRWQKYSRVQLGDRIYAPYPNENYYRNVLGDPADFGLNLKPEQAVR
jgi:hypothetical protein